MLPEDDSGAIDADEVRRYLFKMFFSKQDEHKTSVEKLSQKLAHSFSSSPGRRQQRDLLPIPYAHVDMDVTLLHTVVDPERPTVSCIILLFSLA